MSAVSRVSGMLTDAEGNFLILIALFNMPSVSIEESKALKLLLEVFAYASL